MMHLVTFFWTLELLFGVIGALRGWAKELLVTFSMLVALMILNLIEVYAPWILQTSLRAEFLIRAFVLLFMAFFGYQTPAAMSNTGGGRRDWLQNRLLGFILGLLNGYLIVGSLWFYLHEVNYLWYPEYKDFMQHIVIPPNEQNPYGAMALRMVQNMPPRYLGVPWLYIAVTAAFVFVLVVFI